MIVFMSLLIEKLMPMLSLKYSVRVLCNRVASSPEEGGPKEARGEENNIIISDSILQNILPPQCKNMTY